MTLINRKAIELAVATFVTAVIAQFLADPAFELDIANVKKLGLAGIAAVLMFIKGRLGKVIGDDPNSTSWANTQPKV